MKLEQLEDRLVPATHNWTGAGGNGLWSTAGNWDTGGPTAAEGASASENVILFFPNVANKTATQDIANLIVDRIQFQAGGYAIQVTQTLTLREGFDPNNPNQTQIINTGGTTNSILGGRITTFFDPTRGGQDAGLTVDGTLTISSILAGGDASSGYSKSGTGTLILSGINTFAGGFGVNSGTVVAQNAAALGTAASGTGINEGATLDVQANIGAEAITASADNNSPSLGNFLISSAGTGTVGGPVQLNLSLSNEVLTVGGAGTLTITGDITGGGAGVTKIGAGRTTLSGMNTYTGTTTVSAGTLQVDGAQGDSPVAVANGGILSGRGTVGAITATAGSNVAPGLGTDTPTTLNANGNVTLAGFGLVISGTVNGSDKLVVLQGTVNLNGASLSLLRTGAGVPVGQSITLIDNRGPSAINGTFDGLAQGATLAVDGQNFSISYVAGTGNDVVLTAASSASTGRIIVAPDRGGPPRVKIFNTAGLLLSEFDAYGPGFTGGVRVAAADITGDGQPEIFTAPGPTGAPFVNIFDGVTFGFLRQFQVYGTSFTLGVNLAVGNVLGDSRPEIVVAPDVGGEPFINVVDSQSGQLLRSFLAYGQAFLGGVRIALGNTDSTNGAMLEVLTAPQAGGAPFVNQFNAGTGEFIRQHQVYGAAFTGGLFLASGNVTNSGLDDFIVGPGSGGDPYVNGFDGTTGAFVKQVLAYGLAFKAGVRVALLDANSDGTADIVTGPGAGGQPFVQIVNGVTQAQMLSFLAFPESMTAGLFVVTTP